MTRLLTDDVASIPSALFEYDAQLAAKTGHSLRGIACLAADLQEDEIKSRLEKARIAVIPFTVGEGVIPGFCDAVSAIVSHLGCRAFITQNADVAGLAEAYEKKADIIMLADDDRFVALNTETRQLIENATATGKGFVAGLDLMAGGLNQKKVLVIGCGPVGRSATEALVVMGAGVSIYDINPTPILDLSEALNKTLNTDLQIIKNLNHALQNHKFIIDASPAKDIIRAPHIQPDTYISAPGVPIGLDQDACLKIGDRLLHDPLQIGVATMITSAFKFQRQTSRNL